MKKRRSTPTPAATSVLDINAKESEQREKLFKDQYDELIKKQISNAENFDRSVLTLSASGLGLSLAFIKDTPLTFASSRTLLVLSWGLFGAAVIATMLSFMTSQRAIRVQMEAIHQYYILRNESFLRRPNGAAKATNLLNLLSGIAFIAAITCTIVVVSQNLPHTQNMNLPNITNQPSQLPVSPAPTPISVTNPISIGAGQPVNEIRPIAPPSKGK